MALLPVEVTASVAKPNMPASSQDRMMPPWTFPLAHGIACLYDYKVVERLTTFGMWFVKYTIPPPCRG